ncbi:MAG TPA: hypothetical protein VLM85_15070 [Polyangiaceae bacterium]|nr:hypothetical protein [Polyangiaceae bacterium]
MLLQATLSLDDLSDAMERFTPLEIRLGDLEGKERTLFVERPSRVTLVPDRGLRIETTARLNWTIAGVVVPVTVQAAQIILLPEIAQKDGRDVLRFQLVLESADLKHVPAFLDAKVVDQVNEALQADDARPTWHFLETLSFIVGLPKRLKSARTFELEAKWGAMKVTGDAVVFTVSYDSAVKMAEKEKKP